ncbi:hypothetical protein JCM14469_40560 [Desulfatiferula olefinivorans]
MKRFLALTLFVHLIAAPAALALRVAGTGFGNTLEEARSEALAELSQMIRVEVKSEFSSVQTQKNEALDELKTKVLHLKSDLPILGARFSSLTAKDGFMVDAMLDQGSVPLYTQALEKIVGEINGNLASLDGDLPRSEKVALLQSILSLIDQYYKMRIVAQFLKCPALPDCPTTVDAVAARLSALEKKADTLAFGAGILARRFSGPTVYVYPPTPDESREVTQFGAAIRDHLAAVLTAARQPDQADRYITGTYRLLKDGIELTCHLTDRDNNTVKTALVFFLPSAYAGYTVAPLAPDFEKLIQSGQMVSGDFRVDIRTARGRQDLLYTRGDAMKLMVRMNKPGYFYLISHNIKEKGAYSYLIHFTEEADNRKFIYYLGGDAVNKWVELGEFDVVPPFGVETLQMVASTDDLIDRIPAAYYDPATGLYTIGTKPGGTRGLPVASAPAQALSATRGLLIKKKTASAEASLTFTSMERKQRP